MGTRVWITLGEGFEALRYKWIIKPIDRESSDSFLTQLEVTIFCILRSYLSNSVSTRSRIGLVYNAQIPDPGVTLSNELN